MQNRSSRAGFLFFENLNILLYINDLRIFTVNFIQNGALRPGTLKGVRQVNNYFLKLFWYPGMESNRHSTGPIVDDKIPAGKRRKLVAYGCGYYDWVYAKPVCKLKITSNKSKRTLKDILNSRGWTHDRRRGHEMTINGGNNVGGALWIVPEKGDIITIY